MKLIETEIPDVKLFEPRVFGDDRGDFMETWHASKFADAGVDAHFVQENQSRSARGVLRGIHYQIQQAQGKLVRIVAGEVFDVALDLRRSSPFFGRWVGRWLSGDNRCALWIPPGFAHGFYVTGEDTVMVYLCTDFYAPEYDRTVRWDDPDLGIAWPVHPDAAPKVSKKDAAGSAFRDADIYD